MKRTSLLARLSPAVFLLASCGAIATGDSGAGSKAVSPGEPEFEVTEMGTFNEPWAMAFAPGTNLLFITEQGGTIKFKDLANGRLGTVTGVPKVDYGGQGGLGDIAFLPSEAAPAFAERTIYLSWAEAGQANVRGAVVGRGRVKCPVADECQIANLQVIWRQTPKVTGQGHYSHRLAFSPDGKSLFVGSGERQKMAPAQDMASDLGKVIRIPIDAVGKPTGPAERYSLGHRNILGLKFDDQGRLWDLEHGPRGGDELNLVEAGKNYGWPVVSDGDHYGGTKIPRHATRPDFAAPAISWNPVIAPGDFIFYKGGIRGGEFPEWQGQAIIAGMVSQGLVRVAIEGSTAREAGRIPLGARIREIAEKDDGTLWLLTDGSPGKLLYLHKLHVLVGK